jgi:hypothetical protein
MTGFAKICPERPANPQAFGAWLSAVMNDAADG